MSIASSSSIRPWKMSRSSCTCTSSAQSVGGPRAGDTGGGSSGSPRCARILRMGPGSGLRLSVAAAPRGVTVARMPAGTGIVQFGNVPDGQCRDGPPQLVIRRKHPVVAMPVLPRRRDEIRQTVEELKRRKFDDAIGSRPRGLPPATPPDPVGRL